MENTIGEKIKSLRKSLHLTQTQLAGNEMTKSMLSQIENNLATPSMKNLIYLADKLEKPVSYFLEENYSEDTPPSLPLEKIQKDIKDIDALIYKNHIKEAKESLTNLLKNHQFDKNTKIYADIVYKLGICLGYSTELDESEEKLRNAIKIYESNLLYSDAARAYMELINRPWKIHDYEECLKILKEAYALYQKSLKRDESFEIEYLHIKAMVDSAIGHIDETLRTLDEAIKISQETQMYYKSDELYRKYATLSLILGRYEDFLHFSEKARQFAQFTENNTSLGFIEIAFSEYENEIKNPHKALEHAEVSLKYLREKNHMYFLEKAKAYYLLENYKEALKEIEQAEYPDNQTHTLDFLIMWSGKVYEGLIRNKLGSPKEGIESITLAIEKMETRPNSKLLAFAYKSLSEIYSEIGDFENAFIALKKASDIEAILKGLPYLSK